MDKISTFDKRFIDNHGRERIFNGINIVDKGTFDKNKRVYAKEWDEGIFDALKKNGFDIVRLGFTWEAVEPKPLEYDLDYLDSIRKILDKLAEIEVYAFIDIHQDLYSGFGDGAGDGAPDWATITGKYKYKKPKVVWAEGYFFGKAVHTAFDNFWDNAEYQGKGIQEYFANMWKTVAEQLGNHPAVIGFDILNEPFPGSDGGKVFKNLIKSLVKVTLTDKSIKKTRLIADGLSKKRRMKVLDWYQADVFRKITSSGDDLIKKFDLKKYSPFLNKTASEIRQVNDDGIIFIENCYYSNLGIPCNTPPIKVKEKRDKRQCFAPHGYDLMVDTPAYKYANNSRVGSIFSEHKRTQERLNMPVLVGEWGGNSEGTEWLPHVEFLLDTFDSNKWSNTYWAYFDGLFDLPVINVLCRPRPMAVTGQILQYSYDRKRDIFSLTYNQEREFDVPTTIFAHKKIENIESDGEVEIKKLDSCESSIVEIKTGKGNHKTVITFA